MSNKFEMAMRTAFEDWKSNGKCSEALDLNKAVVQDYFDDANPQFFTGNFNSKIVLIHLNPKRDQFDNKKNYQWGAKCFFDNFDEYIDYYKRFGYNKYEKELKESKVHKSPFDHKQIRFLSPFGIIPFIDNDKYSNLKKVIDEKLQLEVIPYGSPNFNFKKIPFEYFAPFIERVVDLIASSERMYVIFCGRVFYEILDPFIQNGKEHQFKLVKKDGKETKDFYQIKNVLLKNGVIATIAPQFARQGCPVDKYGEKIKKLYGKFD